MNCSTVEVLLPDYVNGELAPSDVAAVKHHIAGCQRCAVNVEQLEALFGEAKHSIQQQPTPAYWQNLLPRIHNRIERRTTKVIPEWISRIAAPMSAAVALTIAFFYLLPQTSNFEPTGMLADLPVAEIQQYAEREDISVISNSTIEISEGDNEVIQELLTDQQSVAAEALDTDILLASLTEGTTGELVAILESNN